MTTITDFKSRRDLVSRLEEIKKSGENKPVGVKPPDSGDEFEVYPASVRYAPKGGVFLAGKYQHRNALFILGDPSLRVMKWYQGRVISRHRDFVIKKCRITRSVAGQLRSDFPFCAPGPELNGKISIAFGDVLGKAAKAQMIAFDGISDLTFSRQCIHQLRKLEIQPEDALDAISWSAFQESYEKGFAAEACQLTNTEDVEIMARAGFTRLSLEPETPPAFKKRELLKKDLLRDIDGLPWIKLRDKFELMFHRYAGRRFEIGVEDPADPDKQHEPLVFVPSESEVLATMQIFVDAVAHIKELEHVPASNNFRDDVILEISFARFNEDLTPFEHYFVINELMRHDILPDYFAPGRITREHMLVAQHFGNYGLSGPVDYFKGIDTGEVDLRQHLIYPDISYMTAIRCIADRQPELFRRIWEKSRHGFENARREHETGLKIQKIPSVSEYSDEALWNFLDADFSEEFLTMTMGAVMTARNRNGNLYLRQEIYDFLNQYESVYTEALLKTYRTWAADRDE